MNEQERHEAFWFDEETPSAARLTGGASHRRRVGLGVGVKLDLENCEKFPENLCTGAGRRAWPHPTSGNLHYALPIPSTLGGNIFR